MVKSWLHPVSDNTIFPCFGLFMWIIENRISWVSPALSFEVLLIRSISKEELWPAHMFPTAPPSARQNPGQWPEHTALRPTGHSPRDTLGETSLAPGHLWQVTHTHTHTPFWTYHSKSLLYWNIYKVIWFWPVDNCHLYSAGYQKVVAYRFPSWNSKDTENQSEKTWFLPNDGQIWVTEHEEQTD